MSKGARRATQIFKDRTKLYALEALCDKITDTYPDGIVNCPAAEESFLLEFGQQMVDYLITYGVHYSQTRMYRPAVKKEIINLRSNSKYRELMHKYNVREPNVL